jgi:hypothetical protein
MLAEVFYPLLGPLPRRIYLRLFDALFAVGTVPEFPELLAASVSRTAPIASSMGSPLRSARAFAWRIRTSFAISATL